jgi:hypothetical protein
LRHQRKRRHEEALVIICCAALGLAAVGGVVHAANGTLDRTSTATGTVTEPVRDIVLFAGTGDVQLVRGGERVEIHETRHYVTRRPTLTRTVENGVLTLRSTCPGRFVFACETDFRVAVPAGVGVRVNTGTGDIAAVDLDSRRVHVSTDVGDVNLDLAGRLDRVDARTDVGDLDIAVPRGTYAVEMQTDVGDRDVRGLVQDERARQSIHVRSDVGDLLVRAR